MEPPLETFNVTLTPEQKKELRKAYYSRSDINLVIKNKDLEGKDQLIVTADHAKRFNEIKKKGKDLDVTIFKKRIRQTLSLIAYNELFARNDYSDLPDISEIFGSNGIFRSIFGSN